MKGEPYVIETPPNVLGIIDSHWFHYVISGYVTGQGQGRKVSDQVVPDGYHVAQSDTFGNWVIWHSFRVKCR